MSYSAAFETLPSPAKEAVYQPLGDVLSGKVKDKKCAGKLSPADREAIIQILRDTKPEFLRTTNNRVEMRGQTTHFPISNAQRLEIRERVVCPRISCGRGKSR